MSLHAKWKKVPGLLRPLRGRYQTGIQFVGEVESDQEDASRSPRHWIQTASSRNYTMTRNHLNVPIESLWAVGNNVLSRFQSAGTQKGYALPPKNGGVFPCLLLKKWTRSIAPNWRRLGQRCERWETSGIYFNVFGNMVTRVTRKQATISLTFASKKCFW